MRNLIAVSALLAVSSVQASQTLKFGDVNYFLKEGQFNVAADVSSTYYKEMTKQNDTLESRGYLLETRYGYGITNELNAFIGLNYAYDLEVENKTTTANTDYSQAGLANPIFGVNYRWLNQRDSRYNVDFGAIARINIEESETGNSSGQQSVDGNYANPRSSLEVNARMGRKWNEANEWQFAAGLVYNAAGEATLLRANGSPDIDLDLDPSTDFFARATYQYRPVNEFMMSLSAQATSVGELKADGTTLDIDDESYVDWDFVYRAKYLINDNFIANFHYGMSRNGVYDRTFNGTTDREIKRRENYFGLGVEFLF
jgi:hypothetical protein